MIKPPSALPADLLRALEVNAQRLVANLDIAPIIADLLGLSLDGSLVNKKRISNSMVWTRRSWSAANNSRA